MAYLLDTHAVVWFFNGDSQLSSKAKSIIENKNYDIFVSIASLWEIAIKTNLNKIILESSIQEFINKIKSNKINIIGISEDDILLISSLPDHHRDPFDRLLIAQASINNFTIITRDRNFQHYNTINILW